MVDRYTPNPDGISETLKTELKTVYVTRINSIFITFKMDGKEIRKKIKTDDKTEFISYGDTRTRILICADWGQYLKHHITLYKRC